VILCLARHDRFRGDLAEFNLKFVEGHPLQFLAAGVAAIVKSVEGKTDRFGFPDQPKAGIFFGEFLRVLGVTFFDYS
jgi:hypothetical protein